jgi:Zn-dependent metalloprotease
MQWKQQQTVDQADWLMGRDIIYKNSESIPKVLKSSRNLRSLKDPESDELRTAACLYEVFILSQKRDRYQ